MKHYNASYEATQAIDETGRL